MSFLAPAFALFAILFVVPIIIHLIGRSRAKVRQFAALELLLRSERKVARRTKLRQLILLTVRALAIAAVPLILSRPFMEAQSDLPATVGGSQSAVIVLDDSLSMSYKNGERTLLAEGKARARRIVSALGSDAEAALLLGSRGGGTPVAELTADRGKLERGLDEVQPTFRATDLSGALKRAAQILNGGSRNEKRVYLISDLAAHGFERDPPWAAGRGPDLVTIDVTDGKARANRAITDLKVETAPHLGPRGVRIAVEVTNFAAVRQKELPLTLRVDGKPVAKGLVDLEPNARVVKRFAHAFSRAEDAVGPHEVAVELKGDALEGDDRRYARVEVRRDLKLLLVDGDPRTARREDELFYLETALRPGDRDDSLMQLTVATVDELAGKNLAEFDAVFLCNAKSGFEAAPLLEYVKKGGGLFVALGDNVDPDAWNAELAALLPQPLASIRSDDNARLQKPPVADHPVLQPMVAAAASGEDPLRAARFQRYALLKPTPGDGTRQTLLKLESGAPILVEGRIGDGRVLWWLSSIDRDWNDLPIQPAFLPLVQQAARHLARAPLSSAERPALVGQRHEIPLAEGDLRVEVKLPSGVTRSFDASKVSGRRVLGFSDTELPGVYRVAAAGADGVLKPRPSATFVVNVDAAESDPTPVSAARLSELRAGGGSRAKGEAPKRRVELWHAMGAALLGLLLVEALLLRRK